MKAVCAIAVCLLFCSFAFAGDNQWTTTGPFGGSYSNILIHPQTSGLVFASGETLARSSNSGTLWKSYDLGKDLVVRTSPSNSSLVIAASRAVFQSLDQGVTWKFVSNNKFSGDFLVDFEIDPANPSILYGITYDRGVYKSVDGGKTWQAKNAGLSFKHCNGCYDSAVPASP